MPEIWEVLENPAHSKRKKMARKKTAKRARPGLRRVVLPRGFSGPPRLPDMNPWYLVDSVGPGRVKAGPYKKRSNAKAVGAGRGDARIIFSQKIYRKGSILTTKRKAAVSSAKAVARMRAAEARERAAEAAEKAAVEAEAAKWAHKIIPLSRPSEGLHSVAANRTRGRSAKNKSRRGSMTAKQSAYRRFFAERRKHGMSAKAIGSAWRASRNKQGVPLSGVVKKGKNAGKRRWRPSLPTRPFPAMVTSLRGKYYGTKKRKGVKHLLGASTNPKHKKSKKSRARANATKRYFDNPPKKHGKKRRAHRNPFGIPGLGGIMAKVKEIVSLKTLKEGAAVLVGAVVASGAPSLLPSWNTGYMGLGLSIVAAGIGAIVAAMFAPQFLVPVAAGGLVIVGLKLVGSFAPKALNWSGALSGFLGASPSARYASRLSGFLGPSRRLGGFLPPKLAGLHGAREQFRAPKI